MATLAERLEAARAAAQVSQADIARAAGVSTASVSDWFSGATKSLKTKSAIATAKLLNVSVEWLTTGQGPMRARAGELAERSAVYNVEPGPRMGGRVPLISWVQAGDWSSAVDNFHPGDADEWINTSVPIYEHTYALRVRGDSMTSPGGHPSFPDGALIVVEPNAIGDLESMIGRFVIVKRAAADEATFKQLVRDAGVYYLKPLNPAYPLLELDDDDTFCGVVRERVIRFF
jgi:SOS-response transcriptional repressor LexA